MVGLSIVLETSNNNNNNTLSDGCLIISPKPHQVINKSTVIITGLASSAVTDLRRQDSGFLEHCFLCRRKLLPAKDIFMYKGDRAFCSVECRSKQMVMDEEESLRREYCSLTEVKKKKKNTESPASYRRDPRNRAGGFAY